jgi:cyclic pyranopterin phosphate synthase
MNAQQIPQLRIEVTGPCGSRCRYCRSTGEGVVAVGRNDELSADELVDLVAALVRHGVSELKLTGGEPGLRQKTKGDVVDIARRLKRLPGVKTLAIVTRDTVIGELAQQFMDAGVDLLTFSVDSLRPERWEWITRVRGHESLIAAIRHAASTGIRIKLNTVVLRGINDDEIPSLIQFAASIGAELKLLEVIREISNQGIDPFFNARHHVSLNPLVENLGEAILSEEIVTQPGGLGHPMRRLKLRDGVTLTIKTYQAGAFYSPIICATCTHFPCDDAIMALRLTPDGKLQFCLLRDDHLIDLRGALHSSTLVVDTMVERALDIYRQAQFFPWDVLEGIREPRLALRKTLVMTARDNAITRKVDVSILDLGGPAEQRI